MGRRRSRSTKSKLIRVIIAVIVLAVSYYFYQDTQAEPEMTYGSNQNEDGFYYYTYVSENDYYTGTNDLIGTELMTELNTIINQGITRTSYAEAKEYLADSDVSLDDDTKVYNVYDGVLAPRVWDSTSWHREHVWPNSRLGIERVTESQRNIASDLHNLRAITPRVNSSRSDRVYTDGSGDADITDDGGFYPGDDHKGDVARIIFYMAVMYDNLMLIDDMELLLNEDDHYTPEGARMGKLSLLLEWHKEDPVDAFERHRNDVIYSYQNNRNPFIDKPEYAHLIWENIAIEDLIEPEDEQLEFSHNIFLYMIKESKNGTFIN